MRRFPSILLIFAILMMTPVGIYTCGSLANSLVFMRGDDMLPFSFDEAVIPPLQLTETAVTSFLQSPMAAAVTTAVLPLAGLLLAIFIFTFPVPISKRKPPTPPPTRFVPV
jgi:hypothetical protein